MSALESAAIDRFAVSHPLEPRVFEIAVSRSGELASDATGVPVLIVLDGDALFTAAAEIARCLSLVGSWPPVIVVGIGYGAELGDLLRLRTADLTPPTARAGETRAWLTDVLGDEEGGAIGFLDFLVGPLTQELDRRYPQTRQGGRHLFGHSLGGLFAAYALMTRPAAFDTFLISSAALWWDDFAIRGSLQAFGQTMAQAATQPKALISVGAREQDVPTEVPPGVSCTLEELQGLIASSRMVDAAQDLARDLRSAGLRHVDHVVFNAEDHASVVPAAISRALALVRAVSDRKATG